MPMLLGSGPLGAPQTPHSQWVAPSRSRGLPVSDRPPTTGKQNTNDGGKGSGASLRGGGRAGASCLFQPSTPHEQPISVTLPTPASTSDVLLACATPEWLRNFTPEGRESGHSRGQTSLLPTAVEHTAKPRRGVRKRLPGGTGWAPSRPSPSYIPGSGRPPSGR
ncbi:hypothetical protein BT67DRAFT_279981 [Trichocladium antarcticum]|uniref:Uncharacterized protein n=1 Tax=Trichocladium antarcticum TaxID=1450529 RepID=A0AAN6UMK4_9PEZI|nr:hypothetical protein BT67DRAFT_279981 [Trichocladium antarcticum]